MSTVHVGNLTGRNIDLIDAWKAKVKTAVKDETDAPVVDAKVTVNGYVDGVLVDTYVCVTNSKGKCVVKSSSMPPTNTAYTFEVVSIEHVTLAYDSAANVDPGGDSDGTTIVIGNPWQ